MQDNIEQQRAQIAKDLNIPVEQVEVLSEQEQKEGTIEQPSDSGEQELVQFLSKEENKQRALQLAEQIQQVCGEKWFTLDRFVKKTAETKQTAFQKLKLCELFELVVIRLGDWRDDRKQFREKLYKVVISPKDKIEAIDRIITYHQDQIEGMKIKRSRLLDQQQVCFDSSKTR